MAIIGCSRPEPTMSDIHPPIAEKKPYKLSEHGHERVDNYYWLRDDSRTNPEVLDYLKAENTYAQAQLKHTEALQGRLFDEIAGRLVAEDQTVPVPLGKFEYFREYRQGGEYPIYLRRSIGYGKEEVLLDVNELAKGHEYFSVGNWAVSHDESKLAFATDSLSRRIYEMHIKDLETGALIPDKLEGVSTSIAWSASGTHLFYVRKDPTTLLPYQVFRHEIGKSQSEDTLIYEEKDQSFYTSVYLTRSKDFIVISSQGNDSSELRVLDAKQLETSPILIAKREPGHEYRVRHAGEHFFVISNWQASNFRLLKIHQDNLGDKSKWAEVVAHDKDRLITDFEVFQNHLVLVEQFAGLPRMRVLDLAAGLSSEIQFPDEAYATWLHSNPVLETQELRYGYSSLTNPDSVYSFDMVSGEQVLLKQDEVMGEFDIEHYESKRIQITARDGSQVPVSIVYRKSLFKKGQSPLYVQGYGAYGYSSEPIFSSKRLSLLDRGVIVATIHTRGGEELGRHWYEDGKLLNKRNTFWDFIDGTKALVDAGYGDPDKVIAMGGSAGGLLMGVIANEAPDLYLGIVAHVPFVDAVTTMLDQSIPLTTGEFLEWGNPTLKKYYDYILSYSPYDQVRHQDYPHMLVTAGLYDSQVQYFEPAKWVAKLREYKTDDRLLLLHTDMTTGHGGASGRYEQFKADSLEYSFVLDILDIDQ